MRELYKALMELCIPLDSPFYFTDHELGREVYRIFLYRMASYTDFCKPHALECRGTMFLLHERPKLVSRPPEKFFNLGENPFTAFSIEHVIEEAELAMDKADGSLISSYCLPDSSVRLKSKGSLSSTQAVDAMEHMESNHFFQSKIHSYAMAGYTVNMEWTSPTNRIVLGYTEPKLIVLNVRNNATGEYVESEILKKDFADNYVECVKHIQIKDYRTQIGNEGYVVRLRNGQHVKLKTDWYVSLHHNKDSVNTPRRLFEACLEEVTDDLKQMFEDDAQALKLIYDMEELVERRFLQLESNVVIFYNRYRSLERKEFAIKAQNTLTKAEFGLTMQLYSGKEPNYIEFMKKNYKLYIGE